MKKKLLFCSILFVLTCLVLTGCDINVNVNGEKEEKTSKKEKTKEVSSLSTDGYEFEYYHETVDYSYIDIGDQYYLIIFGNDDDGYTTWAYETEKTNHFDEGITEFLGCYNEKVVYILDNGKIVFLNAKTGECIFSYDDCYVTNPWYSINYENGDIYFLFQENYTDFLALDKRGNVLKKLDLTEYDAELENFPSMNWSIDFGEFEEVKMIGNNEEDYPEKLIKINLQDFEVFVTNIERSQITENRLVGKVLTLEYSYEMYCFNEDGTFEEVFNFDYMNKYSVLRYKGNWYIDGNWLVLDITEMVLADGGHYEYSEYDRLLVDYEEEIIPINKTYSYDVVYYPDYDGKECVSLDGMLYNIVEPVG